MPLCSKTSFKMNRGLVVYLEKKHSLRGKFSIRALQSYAKWRRQDLKSTERFSCENFAQFAHFMEWKRQNDYREPKVAASIIVISKHAQERMNSRKVPNPNGKWLTTLSKEERKLLPRHEFDQNNLQKTFFYCKFENNIYVMESKGVKQYVLVTCFKK